MSQVVDQLAELTTLRDREVLDTTLAVAIRDLLQPLQLAIHRCVGDEANRRWLNRARLSPGDVTPTSDPAWIELEQLPLMADFPLRLQALSTQQAVTQQGAPHLTVFPLTSDHELVGVLEIESAQALDAAAHRLVDSILRIFRNFQTLLDYSERDTLTGLLNRKTFNDAFYKLGADADAALSWSANHPAPGDAHGAERRLALSEQPRYIGVLDIDHFKQVNDVHGHLIGDEVLLLLSRLMRSVFRFHDQLFRFGGEEFVVLMRCPSDTDAATALERLRATVQAFAFPQVGGITISVGFTQLRPTDTPNTAFERADRAVYWAKGHGRNQVCSHADLVARGELVDDAKVGDVELF